jgi:hypothetical protein
MLSLISQHRQRATTTEYTSPSHRYAVQRPWRLAPVEL